MRVSTIAPLITLAAGLLPLVGAAPVGYDGISFEEWTMEEFSAAVDDKTLEKRRIRDPRLPAIDDETLEKRIIKIISIIPAVDDEILEKRSWPQWGYPAVDSETFEKRLVRPLPGGVPAIDVETLEKRIIQIIPVIPAVDDETLEKRSWAQYGYMAVDEEKLEK